MNEAPSASPPKRKPSGLSFLAWWRPNPDEVQKQVAQYDTLKLWQSARGISLLLCLFTVTVTVLLGSFLHLSSATVIAEGLIWSVMGLLMFRGHRWAFIVGMVLWTVEKGSLVIQPASAGQMPIVQVIWWFIYMGAFYLGFTVEQRRRAPSLAETREVEPQPTTVRAPFPVDDLHAPNPEVRQRVEQRQHIENRWAWAIIVGLILVLVYLLQHVQ